MGSFARTWFFFALPLFAAITPAQTLYSSVSHFAVEDLGGQRVNYSSFHGNVTVVIFVSARCPISNAFNFRINELYKQFHQNARFLVVDPNANESVEEIRAHAKSMEYDFAVYRDPDNALADLLGAKATPDSFVIDKNGKISYHGYIEDAPNPERSKNHALRQAIEAALQDRPAPVAETHARGCAIHRAHPVS